MNKSVWLGHGDVQVFFRAGWAVWTGYPLYQVADHHGWTYHYPPTFALFMGLFANPLPSYPQPGWALPFPAAVAAWYLINVACLFAALHIWAKAVERAADRGASRVFAAPMGAGDRPFVGADAVYR